MENQSDEFYKFYQKKSDEEILKTYVILLKKSEANNNKKQATEINNRLQPIMRITQERNLNLAKHFQLELESEQKKQANINYKKYMIDGVKTLFTGILIWAIGEGITAAFDNKLIFRGAIFLGKLIVLSGLFLLIGGFILRIINRKLY